MGTVNELDVAGRANAETVGFVLSGPGRERTTEPLSARETFLAASFAQA